MKENESLNLVEKSEGNRLPLAGKREWYSSIWLIIVGLLAILVATLHPVEFDPRLPFSFDYIAGRFELELVSRYDNSFIDYLRNVLLFIPFGFGISILFYHLLGTSKRTLVATLFINIGTSLTVEVLQVWYPARGPSLRDVLANGLGGMLGLVVYFQWGTLVLKWISNSISRLKKVLTVTTLLVAYVVYILLVNVSSIYFLREMRFSRWDTSYHLGVGNELSGDRPWRGTISELHISDRAYTHDQVAELFTGKAPTDLLEESLITSFVFEGLGSFHDNTGNLSDLKWQGTPATKLTGTAIPLSENAWLASSSPVGELSEKLVESSQFTLITCVTPSEPQQWGAARIITISSDSAQRNLTLEQLGTNLRIRFRTGVHSENAMRPVIVITDFFGDSAMHRLIITYDGTVLSTYVDDPEHVFTIALTPEVTLFHRLLETRWYTLQIGSPNLIFYKMFYYCLAFIPISLLLALLHARVEKIQKGKKVLLMVGFLLPVTILQVILTIARGFDFLSLFMSLAIIIIFFMATRTWAWNFLHHFEQESI